MPPRRRKTIDDEVDEAYEEENYDSQSSEFSDFVEEETEEPAKEPSRRGRKPKSEAKPKKAPTGRPRGRPRKNPLPTPTTTKDENEKDIENDGALLSALLSLNTSVEYPTKTEDDSSVTTPLSPATPLYPLKKRFLATAVVPSSQTPTETKVEKDTPAQPAKRRPGRPRKDQQQQQPQEKQKEVKQEDSSKDDSLKMTSRQQILYLKRLEQKRDSDDEDLDDNEMEEEEEELEFDSDESIEEKKTKSPKRKIHKKKKSPWVRIDKLAIKFKGKILGTFDVSLFGNDPSFDLGVGSCVEVTQKLSVEQVADTDTSNFNILSFSSNKAEEDKLDDLYSFLEKENSVGLISLEDRILLFIPKRKKYIKLLGLTDIQDDSCRFIGALSLKSNAAEKKKPRVTKPKQTTTSPPTPKSPSTSLLSMDEDTKRKQISLLSIPKIPKNKGTLVTDNSLTEPSPTSLDMKVEIPPVSTPLSAHPVTPNFPGSATAMRVQTPNSVSSSNFSSPTSMYNNIPKNSDLSGVSVMPPNGHMPYDKPQVDSYHQISRYQQDTSSYQQPINPHPVQHNQYPNDYGMQQNYSSHNMPIDMRHPYDSYDNDLKRKRMSGSYSEPARPVSPKRRKSDTAPYQAPYSYHGEPPVPPPSNPPPPSPPSRTHEMYRGAPMYNSDDAYRKPVPPPPPSEPPVSHHSYSGSQRYSQSSSNYPHYNQQTIPPPRRPESSNYGYTNKHYPQTSKPYYKDDGYGDYDRQRYKKYDDNRYQQGGNMNTYGNRMPQDNYSSNMPSYGSHGGMDDYGSMDYRKPHTHYNDSRYNVPGNSMDPVPPKDNPPPPPPPSNGGPYSPIIGDNDMDFDEAGEPTRHLWVGRFYNMKMDYSTIFSDFEKYGQIDSLNLLRDQKCAFVNFAHVKDAVRAKKELEGSKRYKKIAYQHKKKKDLTTDFKKGAPLTPNKKPYTNYQ